MAEQYTDTQRLDWLQSKGTLEIEDEYLGPVTIEQSGERLGRGTDLRAAIDVGLRRERVNAASPAVVQASEPTPSENVMESAARAIYEQWKAVPGWVPWVEGGNSHRQDEARKLARLELAAVLPDGEPPKGGA